MTNLGDDSSKTKWLEMLQLELLQPNHTNHMAYAYSKGRLCTISMPVGIHPGLSQWPDVFRFSIHNSKVSRRISSCIGSLNAASNASRRSSRLPHIHIVLETDVNSSRMTASFADGFFLLLRMSLKCCCVIWQNSAIFLFVPRFMLNN